MNAIAPNAVAPAVAAIVGSSRCRASRGSASRRSQRDDIERADQIPRRPRGDQQGAEALHRVQRHETQVVRPARPVAGDHEQEGTCRPDRQEGYDHRGGDPLGDAQGALARRFGPIDDREHRDGRVGRKRVDERLRTPDSGNADGEEHHGVEEASMMDGTCAKRPREYHHPGQPESQRPDARRSDVLGEHRQVRDQRHRQPEDGHQLRAAGQPEDAVHEGELGRVGNAQDELQTPVAEGYRVERAGQRVEQPDAVLGERVDEQRVAVPHRVDGAEEEVVVVPEGARIAVHVGDDERRRDHDDRVDRPAPHAPGRSRNPECPYRGDDRHDENAQPQALGGEQRPRIEARDGAGEEGADSQDRNRARGALRCAGQQEWPPVGDDVETDDRCRTDEQHPWDGVGSGDRGCGTRDEDRRGQPRNVEECQ